MEPGRVAELKIKFKGGEFGQSVICGVTILAIEDGNGRKLVDDGRSTMAALQELKGEWWQCCKVPSGMS